VTHSAQAITSGNAFATWLARMAERDAPDLGARSKSTPSIINTYTDWLLCSMFAHPSINRASKESLIQHQQVSIDLDPSCRDLAFA